MPKNADFVTRFWEKVDVRSPDECWPWLGAKKGNHEYGILSVPNNNRKQVYAHRVSAMIHFGMFSIKAMVCHHCDTPACVNPNHLYIGDVRSNARDMSSRGRWRNQFGAGPNAGRQR